MRYRSSRTVPGTKRPWLEPGELEIDEGGLEGGETAGPAIESRMLSVPEFSVPPGIWCVAANRGSMF